MSVYVVAMINIHDRDTYAKYESGFMEIFSQYQGKVLSVDDNSDPLEGDWNPTRTVLLEFPDKAAVQHWYQSDAYQELMQSRLAASNANIGVIQGL